MDRRGRLLGGIDLSRSVGLEIGPRDALLASTSWRATAPLRALSRLVRGRR